MPFWVYIIQSDKDNSFYIGSTENLDRRLEQHNSGDSNYTRNKRPWNLVYSEIMETRSESLKREKFLKRQRNREFYKRLIEGYKNC